MNRRKVLFSSAVLAGALAGVSISTNAKADALNTDNKSAPNETNQAMTTSTQPVAQPKTQAQTGLAQANTSTVSHSTQTPVNAGPTTTQSANNVVAPKTDSASTGNNATENKTSSAVQPVTTKPNNVVSSQNNVANSNNTNKVATMPATTNNQAESKQQAPAQPTTADTKAQPSVNTGVSEETLDNNVPVLEDSVTVPSRSYGVDVSGYQGTSLNTDAANGAKFAVVKISEGTSLGQGNAAAQIRSAEANGMQVDAYHFARFGGSTSQADAEAIHAIANAEYYGLPKGSYLACDYEADASGSVAANTNAVIEFMNRVKNAGYIPLLYSGAYYMKSHLNLSQITADFGNCLWVASYPTSGATYSANFNYFPSMNGVAIWQFTDDWKGLNVDGNINVLPLTTGQNASVSDNYKSDYHDGDAVTINNDAKKWTNGATINHGVTNGKVYIVTGTASGDGGAVKLMDAQTGTDMSAGGKAWMNDWDVTPYTGESLDGSNHWGYWKNGSRVRNDYVWIPGQNKEVYYDGNGDMVYGEREINNHWQYFAPVTGAQAKNTFVDLGNKTCYYDGNGNMVYGSQYVWGHWRYFEPVTGAQVKNNFATFDGHTYYYGGDGSQEYGPQKINGNQYYFDPHTGVEAQNTDETINGQQWHFDNNGIGTLIQLPNSTTNNSSANSSTNNSQPTTTPSQSGSANNSQPSAGNNNNSTDSQPNTGDNSSSTDNQPNTSDNSSTNNASGDGQPTTTPSQSGSTNNSQPTTSAPSTGNNSSNASQPVAGDNTNSDKVNQPTNSNASSPTNSGTTTDDKKNTASQPTISTSVSQAGKSNISQATNDKDTSEKDNTVGSTVVSNANGAEINSNSTNNNVDNSAVASVAEDNSHADSTISVNVGKPVGTNNHLVQSGSVASGANDHQLSNLISLGGRQQQKGSSNNQSLPDTGENEVGELALAMSADAMLLAAAHEAKKRWIVPVDKEK